jgi:hypothetical protein
MGRLNDRSNGHVDLDRESALHIPLALAEMLHAVLGPLAEQLSAEGHAWAELTSRVVTEYTERRNATLVAAHGPSALTEIRDELFLASERVCELSTLAVNEASDFVAWAAEVIGKRP